MLRSYFITKPPRSRRIHTPSIMRASHSSTSASLNPPPAQDVGSSLPPMYRYQPSIPRLPIPSLQSTAEKYLQTVRLLVSAEAYTRTQSIVEAFVASPQAAQLQERLEARRESEGMKNWLIEWWNDAAYMSYRDPVVVFVSYFFVHLDDALRKNQPAKRAASLVKAMLPFRDLVESGRLEPEKVRGVPLCMESYKWLFHASRYPVKPADTAFKFDPKTNNHIVVIRRNRFYFVPLADPTSGRELSAAELEIQFERIIAHAAKLPPGLPIGALSSDNRDLWADARLILVGASPAHNAAVLRKIESAMIVVALDETKPVTREEISWNTWTGDGRNRWYDKHQLIVYDNGRSGFLGEHSCMDGTPTLRMNEYALATVALGKANLGPERTLTTGQDLPHPEELVFAVNDTVRELVKVAERRFDELVGKHDLHVLHYEGYGKDYIRKFKLSPDAWVQMVKQLAFHKMFGRPGVTYESAQTRKYQLGRTEVIRSASNESKAWAEAMLSSSASSGRHHNYQDPVRLRELFRKAVARHVQYSAWAADGQGVDRHLFGLKKCLREGEPVPEIYKDESFGKSGHWELSTSQLSSPYFDGWGYGEVVPDGYGLSYSIGNDYVRWTITSLKRRTEELKYYLAEAATEVKYMMEQAEKAEKKQAEARL